MKCLCTQSMELDLDSLLNSTLDSDLDSPSIRVPHRTLDEILNSSDSSPSPPSSPHSSRQLTHHISQFDVSSLHGEIESLDHSMESLKLGRFLSSAGSLEPPRKQSSLPSSRQLSLFAEMKMSAKPGAALAAATAASRSVPSPHAKAIKLRRAAATNQSDLEEQDNETPSVISSSVISDSVEGDSKMRSNGGDMQVNDVALVQSEGTEDVLSHTDFKAVSSDTMLDSLIDVLPSERREEHSINLVSVVKIDEPYIDANDTVELDVHNVHLPEQDLSIKSHPSEDGKEFESHVSSGSSVTIAEEQTDDDSSIDVTELVEEKIELLESEMNSKNDQQKRKYVKPLDLAEEQEKKRAFTGLNWVEGAASQPMRLEGVRRGSTSLGYFDVHSVNSITKKLSSNDFQRDCSSAHVVAVNLNNVVVGTSKGFVLVFPCRYNPHYADNADLSQVKIFGQQGDRSSAGVTSMCFNQAGDLLLVGYSNGNVTMLDIQKETSVKVVTGEQNLPVVHTFFLGQDLQISRQFKAVTGNSKSMFFLHSFSLIPVINRFNIKTMRFLDAQQMGIVISVSPMIFEENGGSNTASQSNTFVSSSGTIGSMVGGVVSGEAGWKLFNDSSPIAEESVAVFVSHQSGVEVRLIPSSVVLARVPKPDGVRDGSIAYTSWKSEPQAQNTYSGMILVGSSNGSLSPDTTFITENIPVNSAEKVSWLAIAWDRKVQVAKLVKSDLKISAKWSVDSTAIGVVWLDVHMLVVLAATGQLYLYAKNGTAIHQTSISIENFGGNDLVAYHTHFLNVFGNPEKAYHNAVSVRGASVYVVGPTHIIVARLLPWKERVQVLRQAGDWMGALSMAMTLYDGQTHGVTDLPKSVSAAQDIIMPYLAELILSYVEEVFSYISVAFSNQLGKAANALVASVEESNVHSEIKEQFTRVGGVSVEFCVHIHRTDILFDDIYSKFLGVHHKETFLELLEPYILRDMLGSLPPEIMQALVEHYNNKGWLQRVEQCILHMNIASLDFNQVVRLCRENGLYGALIYLFNKGLDDYRAPLEELLEVSRNEPRETASALGYRMLVYLKYCFCGLAFPPGHGAISPSRCPSIRKELVLFLLEKTDGRNLLNLRQIDNHIVLHHFLLLDAEATLYVLRCAFADGLTASNDDVFFDESQGITKKSEEYGKMLQNVIDALLSVVEVTTRGPNEANKEDETNKEQWPTIKELGHLFEFISLFIAYKMATVSPSVLNKIFEFLASEVYTDAAPKKKEKQVLALLNHIPESYWHSSYLLTLFEKASFHQVCGMIYKKRRQYNDALDCFMRDENEPINAFVYIDNTIKLLNNDKAFRSNVLSKIPRLVTLSRECAFFVIISHFPSETSSIIAKLQPQPNSLFLYLKTALEVYFSGTLDFSHLLKDCSDDPFVKSLQQQNQEIRQYVEKLSEFPKLAQSHPVAVSDSMIELYLELLCKYERNSVLKFLETFDSYRVEHCLRLCQEYEIIDAAAFLLERVGDVGTALSLTLSSLNEKFEALDAAVGSSFVKKKASDSFNKALNSKEVRDIQEILRACVVLCQRNTPRLVPEESEALWFRLLDAFCAPLLNKSGVMRKMCAHFVREIVEGMVGYVRLPTIMSKVLSDNGRQEFGDFKTTILGMLGTYGFERRILDSAKALIEDDTFYTMSLLKKAMSHGYAPRSLVCCVCNCLLSSSLPFSSSVRLFSCGHSTHLACESDSRGSLSGCPVCLPKKNSKSRGQSDFGLVDLGSATVPSVRPLHGCPDSQEVIGSNQLSRFELLVSLGKDQRVGQVEGMPVLKLAPPAVYHERSKKLHRPLVREVEPESKPTRRLARKSTIFGKQKFIQR